MNTHNHVTRDIKPLGQCPGCDDYHNSKLRKIRVEAAENYYKKTGYVPTEWAVMNFIAGFDKGAEEIAKIKDAQIEKLVEALKYYACWTNWDGSYGTHFMAHSHDIEKVDMHGKKDPDFIGGRVAREALENFRKEVK